MGRADLFGRQWKSPETNLTSSGTSSGTGMAAETTDHEFGTRFDYSNMDIAIQMANSYAKSLAKCGVYGLPTNCGAI